MLTYFVTTRYTKKKNLNFKKLEFFRNYRYRASEKKRIIKEIISMK